MRGTEGLYAPLWYCDAGRELAKLLIGVAHLHVRRHARADGGFKIMRNGFLNDEYNLFKPGAHRIIDRIVDDKAAFCVNGIHLLDAAAIAAPHAGSKDGQYGLLHKRLLP